MLPVLMAVLFAIITVTMMLMGNMAAAQAAENGVSAWASGASAATVNNVVSRTLASEGYHVTPTTEFQTVDNTQTLTVAIPMPLLDLGKATTISSSRSITELSPPTPIVRTSPSGGGGGGGGGVILHHFPMW